jgi:hypothetical protein
LEKLWGWDLGAVQPIVEFLSEARNKSAGPVLIKAEEAEGKED